MLTQVEIISPKPTKPAKPMGIAHKQGMSRTKNSFDLQPPSMKTGSLFTFPSAAKSSASENYAKEQLMVDSHSLIAFDLLASNIDEYLNYPDLLVENGVEGLSSLDLYFNNSGEIDEARSECNGDNKIIRGILVRAARQGIMKWYLFATNKRLKKEQFRNQHFHAEFALSAVFGPESKLQKTAPDTYSLLRRRSKDYCLRPFGSTPGLDVSCLAIKAYGSVYNSISRRHKIMFDELQDELEFYDRKGLNGIGALIQEKLGQSS